MGHHVAVADKRRIALLSNYEAIPASIKAAASGISGVSSFPEHRREALLTGRLEEPLPSPSKIPRKALGRDRPHSSSGMALLIVARFHDILESTGAGATRFIRISKRDIVKQK